MVIGIAHSENIPKAVLAILVISDISQVRQLENARKDFVANVSHELRTPLTSLKGFTETLLGGAFQDSEKSLSFLKMMGEDAERLTRLIDELLELSKIESKEIVLKFRPIPLRAEVDKVAELFRQRIEEKKIHIDNQVPAQIQVSADLDRLKQVFVNLIDNAIKFNKTGGKIFLSAEQKNDSVDVRVSDTGIGIPEKSVPHIFERFYRVDKARSREVGGTGL